MIKPGEITVLFGQPHSGKSTLAWELKKALIESEGISYPIVDGDEIRAIFKNGDYSREGRIRNLQRISDIAVYLAQQHERVIVAAVYPYKEAREYLDSQIKDVKWIHLSYDGVRGRETFHVKDFDHVFYGGNTYSINTSKNGTDECCQKIRLIHRPLPDAARRAQVPIQKED
jgi:energy-coupling factor transporter ATP-binding protein EcfA2